MDKEYAAMSRIHEKAGLHGGTILWSFTQSNPAFSEQVGDGICLALSCYYIMQRSSGQDLSTTIGGVSNGPGLKPTPVITYFLSILAQRQREFVNLKTKALKEWLQKNHLKQEGYCKPVNGHGLEKIKRTFKNVASGHALVRLHHAGSGTEGGGGHGIVVTPGDGSGEARLYDPNFGEFSFDNQDNLFDFMRYLFFNFYFSELQFNNYEFLHLKRKA